MATNITITADSESGFIKVFVNDDEENPVLVLDRPGTTTIPLEEGKLHNLTYFVKGRPGQKYVVKITDPPSAAWTDRDTVDSDGKVTGQHRIRLQSI
jgi:hypothetical protein